ncbi:YybH family protein [Aestuariivivens sediminicola]|uniref:YybH family protein n=1 Tax=Aestuariivivens sediminicola TaxID=2913560 RepID=UPI001F59338F|nr:hypothetical protein [Aestuariivivens sediminicola]
MKTHVDLKTIVLLLVFSISFITGCKNQTEETPEITSEPAFDLTVAKAEIEAVNKIFEERFMAKDSTGVSNLYTSDAKFMMTGSPAIIGKKNIESVMSGFIKSGVTGLELKTIDVWGTENWITEEGEYTLFANENQIDQGKYLILWKNVDGQWLFFRDIFNSSVAAPAAE